MKAPLFLFLTCLPLLAFSQSRSRTQIEVGHGPEDMVLDTVENERLLISCTQRRNGNEEYNGIWEYDIKTGKSRQLILNLKEERFVKPHGIALFSEGGEAYLFVINHGEHKVNEIIRFRISRDTLFEEFSFKHKLIKHPNDLFVVGLEEYYFSNDMMLGGSVGKYKNGSYSLISKGHSYANGVHVIDGKVYVSTTLGNKILLLTPDKDGVTYSKEKLYKIKGGDNFSLTERNTLLVTSHSRIMKLLKHALNPENKSPSMVYELGIDGKSSIIIYNDRTGIEISTTSTALEYKGYLYLAQIFDPYLFRISLND